MNSKLATPIVAITAGVCVLLFPHILNYVVGIYLIVTGILALPARA